MSHILKQLELASQKFKTENYLNDKTDEGWVGYTFSDVFALSKKLAAALNSLGLKAQDNSAILSEGTSRWVVSEYALLFNRATSVPLSVKLLAEELPFRLNHSESKFIFTSKNHIEKVFQIFSELDNQNSKIVYLDEDHDFLDSKAEKYNISNENIYKYWDLIKLGEEILENNNTVIDSVYNEINEDDVVTISYTSGTTGDSKGIMLTHKNYVANSADGVKMFKADNTMKTLIILPIDHCFAHTVAIFGALFSGIQLYFLDTRGGAMNALKNIPINLDEVKPDFLLTVPALSGNFMKKIKDGIREKGALLDWIFNSALEAGMKINQDGFNKGGLFTKLVNYPIYLLAKTLIFPKLKSVFGGNLKYMVGGGALLDIKQQQFFYNIGIPIYQGYGLTEATPIISSNTPFVHKLGSSGKIIPSIECVIRGENGSHCSTGEKGEIVIYGPSVMKGYYKNEEASEKAIREDWLWTGDLGYYDKDGFLVVTGREKALLISEDGEKYSPESIEESLSFYSDVISQVMVHNNHNRFTSAVITLDSLFVNSLIKKKKVKNAEELLQIVENDVNSFKKDPDYKKVFPSKWLPSSIFIAPEDFNEGNKMMNSTLKMVRYKIEEFYQNEIEKIYSTNGNQLIREINIENISKQFFNK